MLSLIQAQKAKGVFPCCYTNATYIIGDHDSICNNSEILLEFNFKTWKYPGIRLVQLATLC